MKRFLLICGIVISAMVATGSAQATPITLDYLVNGGSITVNDKLFDQWTVLYNEVSAPNHASTVNLANIGVTGLTDGGSDPGPGLMFSSLGSELLVTGDGYYSYIDLQFSFRVTVTDPAWLIKDNTLSIRGAGLKIAGFDNGMYINEKIGTAPGLDDLGVKEVEWSILNIPGSPGSETQNFTDAAQFTSLREIYVTKNILIWASDAGDLAELANFEQRFSQTPVPEPATLLLMGTGLAGLIGARRKKKA